MKKLVTLLLCLVLAIGTACMFGCGDATFNGNYKEVTADSEEVQQFAAAADRAENKVVNFGNGADFSLSVKGSAEGMKVDVSAGIKATLDTTDATAAKLIAEGSVKAKVEATDKDKSDSNANVDMKVYYKDKFVYISGKFDAAIMGQAAQADAKNDVKFKLPLDLDSGIQEIIKELPDGITDAIDLPIGEVAGLLNGNVLKVLLNAEKESEGNVKIFIDAENKKVKAEIKIVNEQEKSEINGTLYLVYDENYNLIAIKVEAKMKSEEGELTAQLVFKGYTGTVKVPDGIAEDKDYIDLSLMFKSAFSF